MTDSSNTKNLAQQFLKMALEKNIRFGFAESCTGGLLAHSITEIPGASKAFFGSIVSYDSSVKINVLGVNKETIEKKGVVSEEVAKEMAIGARKVLGVDLAIATTGLAGPGGDDFQNPEGTVCIALSTEKETLSKTFHLEGSRSELKEKFKIEALKLGLDYCP